MGDLLLHNSHSWMTGHTKIYLSFEFPVSATNWPSAFIRARLADAADTFNTARMAISLSHYPVFWVNTPNLLSIDRLLSETTSFLVGASKRPELAASRIASHVGHSDTWGRYVPKSFAVVFTNSRASPSDYLDIDKELLCADALSGLPSLAGKCSNLVECFRFGCEEVQCQPPSNRLPPFLHHQHRRREQHRAGPTWLAQCLPPTPPTRPRRLLQRH